jgi:hypothetical protein
MAFGMTESRAWMLGAVLTCTLSAACASRAASSAALANQGGGHKSYVLPLVEIVAMDAAVNLGGRLLVDRADFTVTPASIRRNLRGPWVVDNDPFHINQFGHAYQGAMYHDIARSNGLGYWPSAVYTFAASALWEIAGEATPPSRNDQIASGIAGSFLGEPLFRISRLLLERSDDGPGAWRGLGSVLASPATGINHLLVGTPAGASTPDAVPFSDIRVQVGASAVASGRSRSELSLAAHQPEVALSMDYGYPGNAAYRHERPFDYFRIDSSLSSAGLERLSTRGLIAGGDYHSGRLAGIWGVYGTYDYFAPDDFRFSSTAFTVGTTLQAQLSETLVVQGSGLVGGGYAATVAIDRTEDDDYHYGLAPQALANLRLIAGRRAALDVTARQYLVSARGGFATGQSDRIFVGDASLAIRLHRRHAVGVSFQLARRDADFADRPHHIQRRSRLGAFYTFLGSGGFGAVR